MQATIIEFLGFLPHWETDHTVTDMSLIVGGAEYMVAWPDGETEKLVTGLRPGQNQGWSLKVIDAAQAWRDAGGVIPEWTPPTAEEQRQEMEPLTARQFRLALVNSGHTIAQVDAQIAAMEDETERVTAEVEWEYATTFNRTHPLVVNLSATLGFTPEGVDALWREASQL